MSTVFKIFLGLALSFGAINSALGDELEVEDCYREALEYSNNRWEKQALNLYCNYTPLCDTYHILSVEKAGVTNIANKLSKKIFAQVYKINLEIHHPQPRDTELITSPTQPQYIFFNLGCNGPFQK